MEHFSNRADLDDLRGAVARIEAEPAFDFAAPAVNKDGVITAEDIKPLPGEQPLTACAMMPAAINEPDRQPFGAWLLQQKDRRGWIGELANAAKSDPAFPKRGSPDDVRKRLQALGADGDTFEALDDAELDWSSY